MDISKYIYDYLVENNTSVVVPDLGCFSIVNKPSEIHDGIVSPPVKTVEFDSENTADDHVLTQYVAKKEMITIEQAADEMQKFYKKHFMVELTIHKKVVFEKFGTFSLEGSGFSQIVFTPVADFFKDNYGLGNVHIPVIDPDHKSVFENAGFTTKNKPESEPKSETDDALFDTNNNNRFRENTDRRRKYEPEQQVSVAPKPQKTVPPSQKKKMQNQKQKQKKQKSGGSSLWVLWVLLIAAALGIGGYFAYPIVYPMVHPIIAKFFSGRTTTDTVANVQPESETGNIDETDQNAPHSDVGESLDNATEKKNALTPANTQQTSSTSSSVPTTAPSTPETKPKPEPVVQTQESTGSGKYVLIVGSFGTRSSAEILGRKLKANGISYEIIGATVEGNQKFRVSVASFDSLTEAQSQASQMKSKPNCENVWVAKR